MSVCTPKSFDLTGKVALITGASYGIGFAIATAMANCGAKIVFNDIKQELVDKGLAAYKEAGIEAHGYVCDVTNEDAVNAMVKQITEEVGHINVLVNNAGIIKRIPMIEMTAAQFRQVIDVDLNAPFIVAKAVIPDMIEQGGGKIINICSMMSELGRETVSAYAAAKGGLKMLTKNIASEYGQYNIQCNGIGPGYIATPQTAPLREIQPDGSRHPFDQFIVAKTPAARWGEAEDLGGPAVFLASEASDFVNGLILYVDGGITTLEDKSCGCVQKGGSAPIMDVIGYGEPVVTKGLNMLYGPGNDLVSATALTAAGAHMVLFSTGRGTPFGAPAPTLKIATNSQLAAKKKTWIDFNAGVVADGERTLDEAGADLYQLVLDVASGKQTCAEKKGFREISIFKDGVVL